VRHWRNDVKEEMTMPDEIDTTNRFGVASGGSDRFLVLFTKRFQSPLQKSDCLNLAAWLVAMADPSGKEFDKVLEAVRNT
jgi:hypothetical protein